MYAGELLGHMSALRLSMLTTEGYVDVNTALQTKWQERKALFFQIVLLVVISETTMTYIHKHFF